MYQCHFRSLARMDTTSRELYLFAVLIRPMETRRIRGTLAKPCRMQCVPNGSRQNSRQTIPTSNPNGPIFKRYYGTPPPGIYHRGSSRNIRHTFFLCHDRAAAVFFEACRRRMPPRIAAGCRRLPQKRRKGRAPASMRIYRKTP